MAPTSPASTCSTADTTTLADIGAELKRMAMRMVTKDDLTHLTNNLHEVIKSEVTGLKAEIKAQEHRIQQVEKRAQTTEDHSTATDTALKRQGTLILAMRRQLEDQDNRSRRNNIRFRTGYSCRWIQDHNRSDKQGEEDGTLRVKLRNTDQI
ncbi:Hypothetical predicted protein [Pelobates cultripes]|nr:Hypothetical predicted protein [Pelobates cultripes]